jgi:elongation factor Ts
MANYTTADITKLREKTGAGMMDVKKALDEANGDSEKALEIIRIKGLKGVEKRSGRKAEEGLVTIDIVEKGENQKGFVVELATETDFVAKSEKFIEAGETILKAVVKADANSLEEAEKATIETGETVQEFVRKAAAEFGENVQLKSVQSIEGENITSYLHKKAKDLPPTIAVLVVTDKKGAFIAKDISHHVAALAPKYLSTNDVPSDIVQKEESIAFEIASNEGKPEHIIPNIVKGRLNGFYKETVLLCQPLVADPKTTVEQYVKKSGGDLKGYLRVQVGE